jgi:hypothetical protein
MGKDDIGRLGKQEQEMQMKKQEFGENPAD